MANRPDIPESGRIQRDQTSTIKAPNLEWQTDTRRDNRYDVRYDGDGHSPQEEAALHRAIARNIGCRRDNNNDVIPKDSIDLNREET